MEFYPTADPPLADLLRDKAAREFPATATHRNFRADDWAFGRYRGPSLASIGQAGRDARRAFLSDLREVDRRSFPETQQITQMLNRFAPNLARQRGGCLRSTFSEMRFRRGAFAHTLRTSPD